MKVSCIQMDMEFANAAANYEKAECLIRKTVAEEKPDCVVLPETWNLGFFPHENLAELADENGEKTKAFFSRLAKELNVNIVGGSVITKKEDGVYNTAYIYDRQGEYVAEYDKTHLFSPMEEDKYFQKGRRIVSFTLDGHKCGIIICYDVRFPRLTRAMTTRGLDFLFMVSQWPLIRVPHLDALTKARAIENQMFVICCNSAGKAGETVYGGNSSINDPWGVTIAHAGEKEEVISAECDTSILEGIRNSINVFADRRPDLFG